MAESSIKAVRWIVLLILLVAVSYLVLVPATMMAWETWFAAKRPAMQKLEETSTADWVRIKSMEAVMAAIFFAVGASVGSFLNVVAYRLPLGIPLVFRRSRCPVCLTPIEGRDNVPLFGWLRLAGHCRHCGTPISVRYPLVEGLVGSMFLLLFSVQLISGGWNLANRTPNIYAGVVWVLLYTKWDLVGFYFYHALLFSLLFVLLLVDYDRLRLSWRQVVACSVWLCLPPLIWPDLYLWPVTLSAWPVANSGLQLLLGAVVGGTLGAAFDRKSHLAVGAAWVGMALGWQAVLGALVVTSAFRLVGLAVAWLWRCLTNTRAGFFGTPHAWTMWLLVGTLGHHLLWRVVTIVGEPYWPGGTVTAPLVMTWLVAFGVLLGATMAWRYLTPLSVTAPTGTSEPSTAASSEIL